MKLLLLAIIFFTTGCSGGVATNEWTGFYYPNKDNIGDESTWVIQPGLSSLKACQDWVDSKSTGNTNFDYECGNNCKYDDLLKLTVCKETLK